MGCPSEQSIVDYVARRLDGEAWRAVDVHVDGCPACQHAVVDLLGRSRGEGASADDGASEPCEVYVTALPTMLIGRTLGHYVIERLLGSGAMGVVYAARDSRLDRCVALKVLKAPEILDTLDSTNISAVELERRHRLVHEAQVLARLNHPNIVGVFDVGTSRGVLYIAMELVNGSTLREEAAGRGRPWRQVFDRLLPAAEALAAAHDQGVIHRDFKPDNVMTSGAGVKVLDFGLARAHSSASLGKDGAASVGVLNRSTTGGTMTVVVSGPTSAAVAGSPAYMAPETLRGAPADAQSDQYAFFISLYELICGHRPFAGATMDELLRRKSDGLELVREDWSGPPWLLRAVARGLHPDPRARFEDMRTVVMELRRLSMRRSTQRSLGALAATAVVSSGVALAAFPGDERLCEAADELAAQWEREGSRAAQQAFFSAGDLGTTQWRRIEPRLREHIAKWRQTYESNCEAGADVDDPTMLCLRTAALHFEAAADVFASADESTVSLATDVVQRLPDPTACARTDASMSAMWERGDDDWLSRAAQVEVLTTAGRHAEAFAAAERSLIEARAEGRRARALLALGILHVARGEAEAAVRALQDAAMEARSIDDEGVFVRAAIELAYHLGQNLERFEEAEQWARHAHASLQREDAGPELRARLLNAEGNVREKRGQFEAALSHYEGALQVLGTVPESRETAAAWNNVGKALFMLIRRDEAAAAYERSREIFVRVLGEAHPDTCLPLVNLASLHVTEFKYALAREQYERVLEHWRRSYGPHHPRVALVLQNLAYLATLTADHLRALERLDEASAVLSAAGQAESAFAARILMHRADTLRHLERWDECVETSGRAMAMNERTGPSKVSSERQLEKLAHCLLEIGRVQEALEHARTSVALNTEIYGAGDVMAWDALLTMGRALHALHQPDEAVVALRQAMTLGERAELTLTARADIRFALARAQHASRSRSLPQELTLAETARDFYVREGRAKDAAEVSRWLNEVNPHPSR